MKTPWPIICMGAGLGILVLELVILRKLRASKSWPQTTGTILQSTIEPGWRQTGGSSIYVVRPKVVYEYEVEGKKFTSSQLALIETNSADEDAAREKAQAFPAGKKVPVYYDPRRPDCAVLYTGDPTHGVFSIVMVVAGLAFLTAGLVWSAKVYR